MKSRILVACLAAMAFSTSAAVSTNLPASTNTFVIAPINAYPLHIVTCREDVDLDALLAEFQIILQNPKHRLRGLKMFFALLDDGMIQRLKADPRVVAVEADGPVSLCSDGIGEGYNAFGIVRMGIPQFPPAHYNGTPEPIDVDVAILDSGIDPHEDLNIVDNYSVFDEDGYDLVGHGTGVADVVGALDNGIGSVGVAPGVRLWNVKCTGPAPFNTWVNLISGMSYVLQHADRISVVNVSLSNTGNNAPYSANKASVRNLVRAGVVVVAAAGNGPNDGHSPGRDMAGPDGIYETSDDALPASLPYSMAVSAMDSTQFEGETHPWDKMWPLSNFSQIPRPAPAPLPPPAIEPDYPVSTGGAIDVAAPGVDIYTTAGGPDAGTNLYNYQTGTSFAAPHVAGLVALYIAANGRATNEYGVYAIRQAIIDESQRLQPQSAWATAGATDDPDTNHEALAYPSEAWIPKPVITNTAGAPGNFAVRFATVPGYDYTVQSATNLTPPIAWENLSTVTGSSNVSPASVTDTNTASQSFYRLDRHASGGGTPPLISQQPGPNWAKLPGASLNLSVSVSGLAPFSYFWQKDGSPLAEGGNLSGTATASLMLTNVQLPDIGAYRVIVTNVYGSVTSAVVTVTLLTNWTSALVTGVDASATSELGQIGRFASRAVNGIHPDSSPWESVGVGQGFGEDRAPAITFDLGAARPLESTEIWNGSEWPVVSVKRMAVEVSNDGVTFSSIGEFTLTTPPPASDTLSLGGAIGRYVRFRILENGAGQLFPVSVHGTPLGGGFAKLDEVEFHEYQGN